MKLSRRWVLDDIPVQGVLTWPEMQKSLVPALFLRPKLENQSGPRRRMVGATATVSTLVTVDGQP
eukprot:scaffold91690_cov19-Prasinocladus_malaysianus.AAC.1